MISSQFLTYFLFAAIWPCAIALVYAGLERLFPSVLVVNHRDE
jgi:hypothetical protein